MKKITIKGLADFMTASPSRQRTILKEFKYPSEDEPKAKILFYRDARERIIAYHRTDHNKDWLLNEAENLRNLAQLNEGQTRSRLNHNARAIRQYAQYFSNKRYIVQKGLFLSLQYGDVLVTVVPDLNVIENSRNKIIKLEFSVNEQKIDMTKIICQGMFEASINAGLGLNSSDVLYIDVPRNFQHKGARYGSRMRSNIEAICQTIDVLWPTI